MYPHFEVKCKFWCIHCIILPTFAARLKSLLNEDTNFTINDYAEMAHIAITDLENYIEGKSTPSSYEICKLVVIQVNYRLIFSIFQKFFLK